MNFALDVLRGSPSPKVSLNPIENEHVADPKVEGLRVQKCTLNVFSLLFLGDDGPECAVTVRLALKGIMI